MITGFFYLSPFYIHSTFPRKKYEYLLSPKRYSKAIKIALIICIYVTVFVHCAKKEADDCKCEISFRILFFFWIENVRKKVDFFPNKTRYYVRFQFFKEIKLFFFWWRITLFFFTPVSLHLIEERKRIFKEEPLHNSSQKIFYNLFKITSFLHSTI